MSKTSPVRTKQGRIEVEGRQLDVICSLFSGRVFLLISEIQKMGTLVRLCDMIICYVLTFHELDVYQEALPGKSKHTFSVSTLLGIDTPEVHVFGRAIAGHLLPANHHLLLGLGLREPSPNIIPQLLPLLEDYKIWETAEEPTASA